MASKTYETIGLLRRLVQLAQAGKLPGRREIDGRAGVALGFLSIQHATTQAGGDAYDAIKAMGMDKTTPVAGQIELILGRHDIGRGAVHTVLIEKQPDDLMSA